MARVDEVRAETLAALRESNPLGDISIDYITEEYITELLGTPEQPAPEDDTSGVEEPVTSSALAPDAVCRYFVWAPFRMNGVWHFKWVKFNACSQDKGSKRGATLLQTQVQCFSNLPGVKWYRLCW